MIIPLGGRVRFGRALLVDYHLKQGQSGIADFERRGLIKTGGRYATLHRLQAGLHEVR